MARLVNRENEFTLEIALTTSEGNVATNADETPTAEIRLETTGSLVKTFGASDVTHPATGTYLATWTPDTAATYRIVWSFLIDGTVFQQTEVFTVFSVTTETGGGTTSEPLVGYDQTCRVTATFLDARGDGVVGVHVRFTPRFDGDAIRTLGVLAREVTEQSYTDGVFSMYLVRGMTGTLAISGLGIVREVTVPDVETVNLFALLAETEDPLAIQPARKTYLIRRTL